MLLTPQLELFPPLNLQALYTWGRCQFSYKAFDMQFIIEIETQIQGNVQLQNIYIYIYTNITCLYLVRQFIIYYNAFKILYSMGVHDTKILLIKTMMTVITLLVQCGIIQFQTKVYSNNHHDDPLNLRPS